MSTNIIDLQPLIDALDRNTAAHLGKAAAATASTSEAAKPAATKPAATKPAGKAAATGPKVTYDQMAEAVMKIKDAYGIDEARSVYQPLGVDKLSEVKEANWAKVKAGAIARFDELEANAGGGAVDPDDDL